jgi:hypothetical protein
MLSLKVGPMSINPIYGEIAIKKNKNNLEVSKSVIPNVSIRIFCFSFPFLFDSVIAKINFFCDENNEFTNFKIGKKSNRMIDIKLVSIIKNETIILYIKLQF